MSTIVGAPKTFAESFAKRLKKICILRKTHSYKKRNFLNLEKYREDNGQIGKTHYHLTLQILV